ncbi:hypothetical protein BDA99DRAFT_536691 [Phascolomyces articulosus]|uniref:Uncharacterized protein n=1 Tax=Phascolomyces articulosus TaxID=60185 RepID=A0AAD5PGP7_9FUNG|nr:hypothetical protein BDA99DRAFT_536691 [Phascolomyces articulosus]
MTDRFKLVYCWYCIKKSLHVIYAFKEAIVAPNVSTIANIVLTVTNIVAIIPDIWVIVAIEVAEHAQMISTIESIQATLTLRIAIFTKSYAEITWKLAIDPIRLENEIV